MIVSWQRSLPGKKYSAAQRQDRKRPVSTTLSLTLALNQNKRVALPNLKLISAGAGSGKTYRLTQEMTTLLTSGAARPAGIIATTFTKRAAAELRERVRVKLLREGMSQEANELKNALIGTVHGLGVKLLRRFAFEAGVSPQVDIIAEEDHQRLFNLSMANVIKVDTIQEIERLCEMLGLSRDGEAYNWRKDVLQLVEVIRSNNFSAQDIERSKALSWEKLAEYLPAAKTSPTAEELKARALITLSETAEALLNNENDGTKVTLTGAKHLKKLHGQLRRRGYLPWYEYGKLAGFNKKVGAKSRDLVADVIELGSLHASLTAFQQDLKKYQDLIFDSARDAIAEYDSYKKSRGRIDYTDMEVLVLGLLDHPGVQTTLKRELDLLMVDEFQDTSPIQLAVFLKLSKLARQSVWVGDPKQSIYGFRGAEPRLMKAVMNATGPMDPKNIQRNSWRSREDIVYACNAIFTKAFPDIPEAAVVLAPIRTRSGGDYSKPETQELAEQSGIIHWHFALEGKARYAKQWHQEVTAKAVAELLANPLPCQPKDEPQERPLRPGDIAILCRSNRSCVAMAAALNKQGLPAAIARKGLLDTAEATLLLACLKYMLNRQDSLSVAEILLFGQRHGLSKIIEDRLDWLAAFKAMNPEERSKAKPWGNNEELVQQLNTLRSATYEHATSELLNLLLERLDLRRIIVGWGDGEQRLSNIDELRRLAVAYEDNCHRQHRAASLGGYLLYLDGLLRADKDTQGASERPEAVNVLTYHRSKGLEWPVVICMDLDQKLRADVWGLSVVAETEEVDLDAPLAGRWLKYWVNPYGISGSGVEWIATLKESVWQETATEEALAEEARLLYVGFTRARDYLVLPTAKNGAPWLDRAFARGGGATPVLDPHTSDAPFDWQENEVTKYTNTWTEPRNLPAAPMTLQAVPFISGARPGRKVHDPAITTETWLLDNYPYAPFSERELYFSPPVPDPATDLRLLSQAIARFQSGNYPTLDPALQKERAQTILDNYLPGGEVNIEGMITHSQAFTDWLNTFQPQSVTRQLKAHHNFQGFVFQEMVDWLITLPNGKHLVIANIHTTGKQLDQALPVAAAKLRAAAQALSKQGMAKPYALFLHIPAEGMLLRLP